VRNQGSIIAAIESAFRLGSLGQLDAQTDDLARDFHFGKPVPYGNPLPQGRTPRDCRSPLDAPDSSD